MKTTSKVTRRAGLVSTIYIVGFDTVFLPTSQRLTKKSNAGEVGDQLWQQVSGDMLTDMFWTKKQIVAMERFTGPILEAVAIRADSIVEIPDTDDVEL